MGRKWQPAPWYEPLVATHPAGRHCLVPDQGPFPACLARGSPSGPPGPATWCSSGRLRLRGHGDGQARNSGDDFPS